MKKKDLKKQVMVNQVQKEFLTQLLMNSASANTPTVSQTKGEGLENDFLDRTALESKFNELQNMCFDGKEGNRKMDLHEVVRMQKNQEKRIKNLEKQLSKCSNKISYGQSEVSALEMQIGEMKQKLKKLQQKNKDCNEDLKLIKKVFMLVMCHSEFYEPGITFKQLVTKMQKRIQKTKYPNYRIRIEGRRNVNED